MDTVMVYSSLMNFPQNNIKERRKPHVVPDATWLVASLSHRKEAHPVAQHRSAQAFCACAEQHPTLQPLTSFRRCPHIVETKDINSVRAQRSTVLFYPTCKSFKYSFFKQ